LTCLTIRENPERPITVELGTNVLAGTTKKGIINAYRQCFAKINPVRDNGRFAKKTTAFSNGVKTASIPPLWDGKAAERIWEKLRRFKF
jgi:UDP-N-acetylglucosamine 2-epimerase (non-hydrolysing)